MARYTDTQVFNFDSLVDSRTIIASGQVTINAWDGSAWVLSDTLTTGTKVIFTKNTRIQIVPDVGASYWIDEGGRL